MPEPNGADQAALTDRGEGKAFRGRASITQTLAGARMPAFAEARIQHALTRGNVGALFRTDRERNGCDVQGSQGGDCVRHGTSIPTLAGDDKRLVQIPGSMPRLSAIPQGCSFNPRCAAAFERGRIERPEPLPHGAQSVACHLYDDARTETAA